LYVLQLEQNPKEQDQRLPERIPVTSRLLRPILPDERVCLSTSYEGDIDIKTIRCQFVHATLYDTTQFGVRVDGDNPRKGQRTSSTETGPYHREEGAMREPEV
jgi:hypothetical protein